MYEKLTEPISTPDVNTLRTFNLQTSIDETNLCFLPRDGISAVGFVWTFSFAHLVKVYLIF